MKREYSHLSAEERAGIMLSHRQGSSIRAIAQLVGRSASTVCRELRRNPATHSGYNATQAAKAYRHRRLSCVRKRKLTEGNALHQYVHDHLVYWRWSPQQIAATLRAMHPDDPKQHVSHETIYAAIYAYARGSLKPAMIAALRQAKPSRGRKRTTLARSAHYVPEALHIKYRAEEIEQRLLPGHWEGDFIKGAFNRSAVGTLVERKTRFVVLCRMDGCTAQNALDGFTRQMKKLPAFLRESLTYDRGSEMACHVELAQKLNIDIWFADPHSPWQRGSNENTNGLLRQFLPKGIDLSNLSQTHLNDIARLLNGRPRQTLGWRSPEQALAHELEKVRFAQPVALDS